MRAGLFHIKSWLPGVENERKRTSERKTASKQASERRGKEIDSKRKRTRKGGRGGDTERRERARVRALKTAQRANTTEMNEWVGE